MDDIPLEKKKKKNLLARDVCVCRLAFILTQPRLYMRGCSRDTQDKRPIQQISGCND